MFYTVRMAQTSMNITRKPATLTLRIGRWFEANATGWGVIALPVVVLLLGAASLAQALIVRT
jgi:hypothetical protein